jgi:hypothetical protein
MIITKKFIPRRTFLRGIGATMALPLLEAMIPAATALAKTAANPVRRLGFVFMPMGCDQSRWTLSGDTLDQLSPILSSLAPVREHVTAITNLELKNAYPGSHATSNSSFLSCAKRSSPRARTIILARRWINRRATDRATDAIAVA